MVRCRFPLMLRCLIALVVAASIACVNDCRAAEGEAGKADAGGNLGFRVPEGFEVSLFADDDLAHDIFSMTIDSHGRVVVAGRGYVKTLHDDNGDGKADRATLFSDRPKSGAHGMYFDGDDLICTGDDSLMKLRDANGDGAADGEPEIWSRLRHPEHGANGVVKGPDGWIYVACGNDAEVSEKHVSTPYSPVKKPDCGAIVRFSPDGKKSEIFAHGFRNPYDLDFNEAGHLFTVDADGERDQYLPWYAPNRLFDVAQGMHHGWVLRGWTRSWNRPAYFYDSVERLVEIGRGSPTGLVVYRHRQFPKHYRGGVLSACWTLGRVYYFPLVPKGSSYESKTEIFMETTGQVGFAPVDLAVGPEGDLFVAIGGRGTRGGVFRVRYAKAEKIAEKKDENALLEVLDADQPLASWSRAKWAPITKKLPAGDFEQYLLSQVDSRVPVLDLDHHRIYRAAQVLVEQFGGMNSEVVMKLGSDSVEEIREAAAWSVADLRVEAKDKTFTKYTTYFPAAVNQFRADKDLRIQRWAYQAMQMDPHGLFHEGFERSGHVPFAPDARIRGLLLASLPRQLKEQAKWESFRDQHATLGLQAAISSRSLNREDRREHLREAVMSLRIGFSPPAAPTKESVDVAGEILSNLDKRDTAARIELIRLLQIWVGDVRVAEQQPDFYAGYAPADAEKLPESLRRRIATVALKSFSKDSDAENAELARLLGMLGPDDDSALFKVLLSISSKSTPADDIHYLIVASRLPGKRDAGSTALTAVTLVDLHKKMAARKWEPSRNWPLVVGELFDELCKRDAALAEALVAQKAFGMPEHSLFAARMTGDVKLAAARKLVAALTLAEAQGEDVRWSGELVEVIASLPAEESLPVLRARWDEDLGLRDAIAVVLAKNPVAEDRGRLVAALGSAQQGVVLDAARALVKLPAPGTAEEIAEALRALRSYVASERGDQRPFAAVRKELAALAAHWSGEKIEVDEKGAKSLAEAYRPWFAWFETVHPEAAKKIAQSAGVDAAAWAKRLVAIDWNAGDATRGKAVFERRSCHRCHGAAGRLGPDLAGAASRFSREDLLAAIYDPNRDVSPLYQTTQVTTRGGQTHFGLLVYESPEGTLLQTGPDTTIRVTDEIYTARRESRMSLMPTGLLDGVSDGEVADLVAYLREAGK